MAKGLSYNCHPKISFLKQGVLLKAKHEITGANACGLNEDDEAMEFGSEPKVIPKDSICLFVEDEQFMTRADGKPMSIWVRCKILTVEEDIIWFTLVCEPKRIWDFETFRGKKRIIQAQLDQNFEMAGEQEELQQHAV